VSDIVERLDADLAIGCSASMGDTKEARDEIVRLRQINEDHCRAVNTLSVEAVELTRQRDEAHEIIGKAVVNVPPELRSADPSGLVKVRNIMQMGRQTGYGITLDGARVSALVSNPYASPKAVLIHSSSHTGGASGLSSRCWMFMPQRLKPGHTDRDRAT
jgi:hypothetical protein